MNFQSNDPEYQSFIVRDGAYMRIDPDYYVPARCEKAVSSYLLCSKLRKELKKLTPEHIGHLMDQYQRGMKRKRLRDEDYTDHDGCSLAELLVMEVEIAIDRLRRRQLLRCHTILKAEGLTGMCKYLMNVIIENETKIF